jgi:ATP-dependent DNA helicase RecG
VYVVVPAIEEGPREVAATRETAARVSAAAPGVAVGMLHGRLRRRSGPRVLADFAAGRIGILVATTVVEVGVDVAEATFMVRGERRGSSASRNSISSAAGSVEARVPPGAR